MAKTGTGDVVSNGLLVVQGELSTLLTVMRRPFKWSSRVYQVVMPSSYVSPFGLFKRINLMELIIMRTDCYDDRRSRILY